MEEREQAAGRAGGGAAAAARACSAPAPVGCGPRANHPRLAPVDDLDAVPVKLAPDRIGRCKVTARLGLGARLEQVRQLLVRQSRHRRGRVSGIICEGRSSGRGGILCCGLLDNGRRRRRGRDARGGCSSFGGRGRVDGSIRGGFVRRWRSSHGRSASEGRCCKSLACGQYLARFSIRAILRARALARGSGSSSVVSRHLSFLRVILAGALARAFGLVVVYFSLHRWRVGSSMVEPSRLTKPRGRRFPKRSRVVPEN